MLDIKKAATGDKSMWELNKWYIELTDQYAENRFLYEKPMTPHKLIGELVDKANIQPDAKIAVIWTVEMAAYLERAGFCDITVVTDKYDRIVAQWCKKFIGCEYMTIEQVEEKNMKFDVVIGNPPFQLTVGENKKEPIWDRFVKLAFSITKNDGYVALIHPSGWRSASGRFGEAGDLIKNSKIIHLSLNDLKAGIKTFGGVKTDYDWYVCQKTAPSGVTTINDMDGKTVTVDISGWKFIPSGKFDEFKKLIAGAEDQRVSVVHSYSSYETRKPFMSKMQTQDKKFPCVYGITQKDGVTFYYSSHNGNGHFGVPKVIWGGGSGSYPIVDRTGEYGLTQFAFGIAADAKDLDKIKEAMMNEEFIKLMSYCPKDILNDKWSRKELATFKKDFWKRYVKQTSGEADEE